MKRGSWCYFFSANISRVFCMLIHERVLDFLKGLVLHPKLLSRSSIPFVLFLLIHLGLQLLSIKGTLLSWGSCLLLSFLIRGCGLRNLNGAMIASSLVCSSLLSIIALLSWLLRKWLLLPLIHLSNIYANRTLTYFIFEDKHWIPKVKWFDNFIDMDSRFLEIHACLYRRYCVNRDRCMVLVLFLLFDFGNHTGLSPFWSAFLAWVRLLLRWWVFPATSP